jgi:hypothetical protein
MSLAKKLLILAAPAALLALGGCATGLPTQVSRFQALPAPAGQSFVLQAADPEDRGGLEFSRYADLVRRHMIAQGYSEASSLQSASLIVSLGYGVDDGRQQVVTRPALGYSRFGLGGGFGYRPYWSRFGGYGRLRSPFYYGWNDNFWGGGFGDEVDVYTVYTSFLDMEIRRPDGQSVFEGLARARSRTDELNVLVPNLIEAMFTGFPGNNGETVKITVAPERKR